MSRPKKKGTTLSTVALGRQAKGEFDQFVTPDTGRKFTELYNVQHLTSNQLDSVAWVTICTIQRSMLRGEEMEEDLDEKSGFDLAAADDRPRDVAYTLPSPSRHLTLSSPMSAIAPSTTSGGRSEPAFARCAAARQSSLGEQRRSEDWVQSLFFAKRRRRRFSGNVQTLPRDPDG